MSRGTKGSSGVAALVVATVVLAALTPGCQSRPTAQPSFRLLTRDPGRCGVAPGLQQVLDDCKDGRRHVLLTFARKLTLEDHRRLVDPDGPDIRLLGYLGDEAYAASVPCEVDFTGLPLACADLFAPTDKQVAGLESRVAPAWALEEDGRRFRALVQFYSDVTPGQVLGELRSLGIRAARYGSTTVAVTITYSQLDAIARLDSVKSIQPGPVPFVPLNETVRLRVGTDLVQQPDFSTNPPTYALSGSGVRLGICDKGIDADHRDFGGAGKGPGRLYKMRTGERHGTLVASVAGGNGVNSADAGLPAFFHRGQAPEAELGDYPGFGTHLQGHHDAIVLDAVDATNHSYVQSYAEYEAESHDLDRLVRGDAVLLDEASGIESPIPARPQVWAAGNSGWKARSGSPQSGYHSVFTSAKNTISVGSVDSSDGRLSRYSSLGPTADGRIKPDLVAPGCRDAANDKGVHAAEFLSQGYSELCGTSMAAPVVTGILGLLMEAFAQTWGTHPRLYPSTYKAILINTAEDLIKVTPHSEGEFDNPDTGVPVLFHRGPDLATGYGMVHAVRAVAAVRADTWRESTIAAAQDREEFCLAVPEGSGELRVTLAWDDEPGDTITPQTASRLVNDLDLTLVAPDGQTVMPWTLDAPPADPATLVTSADVKPADRAADHRNNVERIDVGEPAAGSWRVRVTGFDLPLATSQPYSLAASLPFVSCPEPPADLCEALADSCEPSEVCTEYPWSCRQHSEDDLRPAEGRWSIDPAEPLSVRRLCSRGLECPVCTARPWEACDPWSVRLVGVPAETRVVVFDEAKRIVYVDDSDQRSREIPIPAALPGDRHFVLFTDRNDQPSGEVMVLEAVVVQE